MMKMVIMMKMIQLKKDKLQRESLVLVQNQLKLKLVLVQHIIQALLVQKLF